MCGVDRRIQAAALSWRLRLRPLQRPLRRGQRRKPPLQCRRAGAVAAACGPPPGVVLCGARCDILTRWRWRQLPHLRSQASPPHAHPESRKPGSFCPCPCRQQPQYRILIPICGYRVDPARQETTQRVARLAVPPPP